MPEPTLRSIVSLDTFKGYLRLGSNTEHDAVLSLVLERASAFIERVTMVDFLAKEIVETIPGDGQNWIATRHIPVKSVESVTIDDQPVDFALRADYRIRIATRTCADIVVTYTAGYDVTDGAAIPPDIYGAVLDLAKLMWDSRQSGTVSMQSFNMGGMNVLLKSQFPTEVRETIKAWTRPTIG